MTAPLVDLARVVIYNRDAVTVRGTVAGAGLSWTKAKDTDGTVSFSVNALETALAANPALLDDALGMVEMRLTAADPWLAVFPFVCQPGSGTVVGAAEGSARQSTPVAKGALWLTSEMLVLHAGGVTRRGARDRYKGWQSPAFNDTAWTSTTTRHTRAGLAAGVPKYGQPAGWPDPAADWLDSHGPLTLYRSPPFTVSTIGKVQVVTTADEEYRVYLGEELIIEESDQEVGYRKARVWEEVLQPGTYTLAAEMLGITTPGGDGFDAFSATVARVDAADAPILPALLSTGPTWKALGLADVLATRPGLTVGQILGSLLDENAAWGIGAATLLGRSFTDTLDSDGVAWPAGVERSWPVGATLAQVIADLTLIADFDVTPDWTLNAYGVQGQDRTGTVALTPGSPARAAGENLLGYDWAGDPLVATRALILTQIGWTSAVDAALESAHSPRAIFVESTQSVSADAGVIVGLAVLAGQGRRTYTAQMCAVTGAVPLVDFNVGDLIVGLDPAGGPLPLQVVSISAAQGVDPPVLFTVELKEP